MVLSSTYTQDRCCRRSPCSSALGAHPKGAPMSVEMVPSTTCKVCFMLRGGTTRPYIETRQAQRGRRRAWQGARDGRRAAAAPQQAERGRRERRARRAPGSRRASTGAARWFRSIGNVFLVRKCLRGCPKALKTTALQNTCSKKHEPAVGDSCA